MLDVKKLITGFLILALGASASAWILSGTNGQVAKILSANNTAQNATTSSLGDNAFYPSQNIDVPTPPGETTPSSTNLTDGIADAFVNGIIAANPNGPQEDANGNASFTTPDDQTLADALQSEPSFQNQNIALPDWDTEVVGLQNKIKIVPYSLSSATDYLTSVDNIINSQIIKTGLGNMASVGGSVPSDDGTVVATGESAASNMLSNALLFPTPTPLVAFQKSLIKLLVYQRDLAQLVLNENGSQDPAMTVAILQAKENDYEAATQDFNSQGQKLDSLLVADNNGNSSGLLSLLGGVLFVNEAHAQGALVDDPLEKIETAISSALQTSNAWAIFFEKLAENIALQIVKNTLMALIQQKVLAYIQNSGAPRFITNMGTEMVNAAEQSALNAINSNFSCINTNGVFPKVQVILNAIYKPGNNVCASQFASQLSSSNLNNFLNNFSNGGFVTFGQTLTPSNNFYGGLAFTAQNTGRATQQSQNVFSVKTTASQGYRNSQVCPDGSSPSGFHCQRPNGSVYNVTTASCNDGGTGSDILIPNDGQCANGQEPTVTMPGIINTQSMDQALGGHTKLIAAANDIVGIVQAAASSLLTGIVNAGINAVTQSVNGALQGDGGVMSISTSTLVLPPSTSTLSSALSCTPANFTMPAPGNQISFTASGGTYDVNGNPPDYNWASSDGQTGTGIEFDVTYNATGTYTITLSDAAGDASANCFATVNDTLNSTTTATSTGP